MALNQQTNFEDRDPALGFDPWLEISRANLTWNVEQLSKLAGGRPILAMLKDNAYGHGLIGTARHLETLSPICGFGVFKAAEVLALRDASIKKPVLHVGFASDAELEELVVHDVMPSIFTDRGELLAKLAARLERPVRIQLYVDTGLSRMGIAHEQALGLVESLAKHRGIVFDGVVTELSEEDDFDMEQIRRLREIVERAKAKGIRLGTLHAASSGGIFHCGDLLDVVRPGVSLFGAYPDARSRKSREVELRPTISLKARIVNVKKLREGDSVQYHKAYVAKKPIWVATLPVGHADGYPRETAGRCEVMVKGRRYPVIASISANHAIIEIGDEPAVAIGDEATLIGGEMDAEKVAELTKISVYSILMHMNPLLGRKFV